MDSAALPRVLGLRGAVVLGMGAMLGAGVFSVWGPAASAAGSAVGISLVIAAVVAFCNAWSTARLAAEYPTSGGVYTFGRARLGPWWGYTAGWSFVVGKTSSCGAIALTLAAYLVPSGAVRPVAAVAAAVAVAVTLGGIRRSARVTAVTVALVVGALLLLAIAGLLSPERAPAPLPGDAIDGYGVLQAAGLLFFAFAGYARIATLGEEVREPARTIPRAIAVALGSVLALYALVAVALLAVLGPGEIAASADPIAELARALFGGPVGPVTAVVAALACAGSLLALLLGISRTALAMARQGDLPGALSVTDRRDLPWRVTVVVGAAVVLLVLIVDVRNAIGFSSFAVLSYYFIANVAAARRRGPGSIRGTAIAAVGAAGCLVLALTLPWQSAAAGAAVVLLGVLVRALRLRAIRPH